MSFDFSGVITALATPFQKNEVDYRSFQRLVIDQVERGVDGIVVNGTTGESPTLTIGEVEKLFEIAKHETQGKIPVIMGTGLNCTRRTIELTQVACRWGADAALVVTPYYNKPPQRGLLAHFLAVAERSEIPVILYNVPGRTITAISPETTIELAKHPQIKGIKEASGDLSYLARIKDQVPKDFALLSGDDETCVAFCEGGGRGVISVVSHVIPEELKKFILSARKGDAAAKREFTAYTQLIRLIYAESNPIPVKAALYLMGIIDTMDMRLPLTALVEPHLTQLRDELQRLGKIGE